MNDKIELSIFCARERTYVRVSDQAKKLSDIQEHTVIILCQRTYSH